MLISELNTFVGEPGPEDFLATDNGQETTKIPAGDLGVKTNMTKAEAIAGTSQEQRVIQPAVFKEAVEELAKGTFSKVLVLDIAAFSSLPKTVTNENITSDMVVINSEFGTPEAQTADWTVTTSNGSLQITGTNAISGSTTLKLYLARA